MFDRVIVFLRPKVLLVPAFITAVLMSMFIGQAQARYDIDGTYITTAGKVPLVFNDVSKPKKRSKKYNRNRRAKNRVSNRRSLRKSRAAKRTLRKSRTAKRSLRKSRKARRSLRKSRKARRSLRKSRKARRSLRRSRTAKRSLRKSRRANRSWRKSRKASKRRSRSTRKRSRRLRRHASSSRRSYRGGSRNLRAILRRVKPAGLPYSLAAAVITVESRWRVNARGGAGEYGLMQLMPATARSLGLRGNPYNPANNMRAGTKYLYMCYKRARKSIPLTIGCYNRGPGNMYGWRNVRITRNYVAKVQRLMGRRG